MTPLDALTPRWAEISALLDEALALPADARAAWLEALIGERAELRESLRRLLAAQASVETGSFLHTLPKLDNDAPAFIEATAGALVGPYRLVSELGRGGMGAVWLAERADGQLKRRVALKLPHLTWSQALGERLARERDLLASLAHVHIARLYDAGVDRHGRPYLAMEYVEGEPIDVYCRGRALPLRVRIALLLQVCDAVAHAHSRLVVHRDLKPGNVLVTPDGQVRLLDFGIAKLMEGDRTEETALTQMSGRALTPDYASPEQIRGEPLGTASDVYSLAVVAYELLTGARPYRLKRGSVAELEEAIANADPPLASSAVADPALKRQLRGDLDAILTNALRKSSTDRYATVDALSQDLRRHLDHEPVQAQPDRLAYRIGKFVRRHRLQVAAGSLAALALLVGASVAMWQGQLARRQAERAERVAELVLSLFKSALPDNAGHARTAGELMQLAQQRIEEALGADHETAAKLLLELGYYREGLGDVEGSLAVQRQAVVKAERLAVDNRVRILAEFRLGVALARADRADEAVVVLGRVMPALSKLPTEQYPDALRSYSTALYKLARLDESIAAAQASMDAAHQRGLLEGEMYASDWLATLLWNTSRPGSLPHAERAYRLSEQLPGLGDRQRFNARILYGQALVNESTNRAERERAIELMTSAIAGLRTMIDGDHYEFAFSLWQLGKAQETVGNLAAAVEAQRESFSMEKAQRPEGSPERALAAISLAEALSLARRHAEALALFAEARSALSASDADGRPSRLRGMLLQLAWAQARAGRSASARAALDEARQLATAATSASPLPYLQVAQAVVALEMVQGLEALDAARAASEAIGKFETERLMQARIDTVLADALLLTGDANEALRVAERAVACFESLELQRSPDRTQAETIRARALTSTGRADAAVPVLRLATSYWEALAPTSVDAGRSWAAYAEALSLTGAGPLAADAAQKARTALGAQGTSESARTVAIIAGLDKLYAGRR